MNKAIEAFNSAITPYEYRIIPSSDARYYGWEVQQLNEDAIWKTFMVYLSNGGEDYPIYVLPQVFAYILACIKSDIQKDFSKFIADELYEKIRNR